MKKSLLVIGICSTILAAACSSNGSGSAQDTTPAMDQTGNNNRTTTDTLGANAGSAPSGATAPASAGASKGKDLMESLDCVGCHQEKNKLVGPAYAEIAAKYPANDSNIDMLAAKIISGGQGNWGEVPMSPHPGVSKEDATEMVKYILSVK